MEISHRQVDLNAVKTKEQAARAKNNLGGWSALRDSISIIHTNMSNIDCIISQCGTTGVLVHLK